MLLSSHGSFVADQIFNAKTTSEYSSEEVDKALGIVNSIPEEYIGTERNTSPEAGYYLWIAGELNWRAYLFPRKIEVQRQVPSWR